MRDELKDKRLFDQARQYVYEYIDALNDIGTNFDLKDDAVDLLIRSADEMLRASPEFQAFLKHANGRFKQP